MLAHRWQDHVHVRSNSPSELGDLHVVFLLEPKGAPSCPWLWEDLYLWLLLLRGQLCSRGGAADGCHTLTLSSALLMSRLWDLVRELCLISLPLMFWTSWTFWCEIGNYAICFPRHRINRFLRSWGSATISVEIRISFFFLTHFRVFNVKQVFVGISSLLGALFRTFAIFFQGVGI